jgi:hypothetical protein
MILVVTTNGIFVIDTSLYHAPIILMLDGKVIFNRTLIQHFLCQHFVAVVTILYPPAL